MVGSSDSKMEWTIAGSQRILSPQSPDVHKWSIANNANTSAPQVSAWKRISFWDRYTQQEIWLKMWRCQCYLLLVNTFIVFRPCTKICWSELSELSWFHVIPIPSGSGMTNFLHPWPFLPWPNVTHFPNITWFNKMLEINFLDDVQLSQAPFSWRTTPIPSSIKETTIQKSKTCFPADARVCLKLRYIQIYLSSFSQL